MQVCVSSRQRCIFCKLRNYIQFDRHGDGAASHPGTDGVRASPLLFQIPSWADSCQTGKQRPRCWSWHLNMLFDFNFKKPAVVFFCLQSQAYEFQFGLEYAWTMCIFAVSMTYSITCPMITPFGEQHAFSPLYQQLPLILTLSSQPSASQHVSSQPCLYMCCVSPYYNLTLLCCLPVRCRLCEFAAVVPGTQTQRAVSQTPTLLLSLPAAHQASIYFCSLIVTSNRPASCSKLRFCLHFTQVFFSFVMNSPKTYNLFGLADKNYKEIEIFI